MAKKSGAQDWEYIASQLWGALQPFANSVRDWEATHAAGDTIMDPARKNTGFGRELAVFRAKYRLSYNDFKRLHEVLAGFKRDGIIES